MAAALPEYETCLCCYDDEVQPDDAVCCPVGHLFCIPCVRKGVEIKIGEAETAFPCLTDCEYEFSHATLEFVLEPSVFARLAQRKQKEEVLAAEMDDFEECPFCDFGLIPYEGDTLFTCLNPACMKISCRLCKEINHLPLLCDEVEKNSEVKARTFIEDKMTEALLRTCNGCSKKFVKEDGCNLMTCVCGSLMCYLCRKTIQDHSHFRGWADQNDNNKCILYSTNDSLHVDAVNAAADRAKAEISAQNPALTLRHDPTLIRPERTSADVPQMGIPPGVVQPRHQPRQEARAVQDLPQMVQLLNRLRPLPQPQPQPRPLPQLRPQTRLEARAMQMQLLNGLQLEPQNPISSFGRPSARPPAWIRPGRRLNTRDFLVENIDSLVYGPDPVTGRRY